MYHSQLEFSPHDCSNILRPLSSYKLLIPSANTLFTGICVSQTAIHNNTNKALSWHPAYGLSFNTFETPKVLEPADEFLYFFHPPPRQSLTESWLLQDTTWRRRISGMSTSCGLRLTQEMHEGLSLGGSQGVRPGRPLLRKRRKLGPFKPRRAGGYVTSAHA